MTVTELTNFILCAEMFLCAALYDEGFYPSFYGGMIAFLMGLFLLNNRHEIKARLKEFKSR